MTALASDCTVPALPLGNPPCGTLRYGMTPEMARLYRWIVENRPHSGWFRMHFRDTAKALSRGYSKVHGNTTELVVRGWLKKKGQLYSFVEPIQFYAERRNAA